MSRTATDALRAAAFGCAAVALVLLLAHDRADGPRRDVLAVLLAGAACAGAWAWATRREPAPVRGPSPWRGLPSVLPRNPVDWYAVAGALLVAVAPFAAYRFAALGEVHEVTLALGCLPLFFWGLAVLPVLGTLLVRRLSERHRLLARDAKEGRVPAVRFELEDGQWVRIIDEENRRLVDPRPDVTQMLKLRDARGDYYGVQLLRPGVLGPSPVGQFSRFTAEFRGGPVWVMWPDRWEAVLAVARRGGPLAYPVVVVSETGAMVWGYSAISWSDRYLTDPANRLATVPGLAARPLRPRPAFHAPVHGRLFAGLGIALAALAPLLLDLVSGAASAALGGLAAVAVAVTPLVVAHAAGRHPDTTRWDVPPVQDFRVPSAGPH
ncbi:hypothetical protein SNE510_23320 [Streptomyces sp. NE5-10]|uniref:hypothetical protein n=1 Tax=Streptomyces sp. NE5-10 TaxID=2759674 RepID=UPI00190764AF|nr:hypothetical protein [Streptomyces sp. NE5-10]GHJ92813.1 hypothetical protein SNE510_23320 [Streptomyces sp. NE5-10]